MFIKVMLSGGETINVDRFYKSMQVEDLRQRIAKKLEVSETRLRLFFRGKQLEDGVSVYDYDIEVHSTVLCMVKQEEPADIIFKSVKKDSTETSSTLKKQDSTQATNTSSGIMISKRDLAEASTSRDLAEASTSQDLAKAGTNHEYRSQAEYLTASSTDDTSSDDDSDVKIHGKPLSRSMENLFPFQVGDMVEMIHDVEGAWFTVVLRNIYFDDNAKEHIFIGEYKGFDSKNTKKVNFTEISTTRENIRFPVQYMVALKDVNEGDIVKVIYSLDETKKLGLWYDCIVRSVQLKPRQQLVGDIIHGRERSLKENCAVTSTAYIFRVSDPDKSDPVMCEHCEDKPSRKCLECACRVCGVKGEAEKQLVCDECDYAYHIWCLDQKLDDLPDVEQWYCPLCKNDENEIIKAGERPTPKMSKVVSCKDTPGESARKKYWGQGMACVGRKKVCTVVPCNHFGPIPGVEVGSSWMYRVQVAEAGVHRPQISGVHGRREEGAYSIVLSGGYEDDTDDGDTFVYTGCGGKDLSGNKRTGVQNRDQKLEHVNLALARNCNAPINKEVGAVSEDWQKGKPVRVVRNYKAIKHSKYAPKEGNRYDGIYKVVKYFPIKGKSGFLVWRFQLQRDDPIPAPWTETGKERIELLGLEMQVPEGYEYKIDKSKEQSKGRKRKENELTGSDERRLKENVQNPFQGVKKAKIAYEIEKDVALLIEKDNNNIKLWTMCKATAECGKQEFLNEVLSTFNCICCQELVYKPITTSCKHNFCQECMDLSFAANVSTCPYCRCDLSSENIDVNKDLENILLLLFPGYTVGR